MLGNAVFRILKEDRNLDVLGIARSSVRAHFSDHEQQSIYEGIDLNNLDSLFFLLESLKPNLIINCIGLIKQLEQANDYVSAIKINALFPHQLANFCKSLQIKLVHFSTDCVFNGSKGDYKETDFADANDLYGRSKFLGELNCSNTLTIRTSIIGHELSRNQSLLGWFLQQEDTITGYCNAIFSGLPTNALAKIVRDIIIPRSSSLNGLYHIAANPISKYDLLNLIAKTYQKKINILPDESFIINRSLNADKFYHETGYRAPDWEILIKEMYLFFKCKDKPYV